MEDVNKKTRKAQTTSTDRMRKYRKKLKEDPKKQAEAKKQDRERKKREREKERLNAKKDPSILDKIREKKKLEMRKYRQKRKKRISTQSKLKRAQSKKAYKEKKKVVETKKKNAVMRTQNWRMRIKLKAISSTEKSSAEEIDSDTHNGTPTFRNRMSKNRALRRAKASMPETPSKRAELICEIASSPRCSKHLQTSFLTPEMKENAKLGEQLIESFSAMTKVASNSKDDKTGAMKAKRTLKTMLAEILENTEMKRKVEKKVGLWTKKKKRAHGHPWWMTPIRKVRKDCIMGKNRKDVTDFFLSGEVTREVPNKKDVSK